MKILVVDDEKVSRAINQKAVQEAGHDPVTATSGAEAIDLFRKQHYSMVIVDWMMPGMDGLALTARLREIAHEHRLPVHVIMVTGRTGFNDVLVAFENGVDDFLVKPVSSGALVERIQEGLTQVGGLPRAVEPAIDIPALVRKIGEEDVVNDFLATFADNLEDQGETLTALAATAELKALSGELDDLMDMASMMESGLIIEKINQLRSPGRRSPGAMGALREAITQTRQIIQDYLARR